MTGPATASELGERFRTFAEKFQQTQVEMQKAIVGHEDLLRDVMVAVIANGHVLLEGVPGLGKTYLVRILGRVLELDSGRVQCTPDLMPADVLGTHIVNDDGTGRRVFNFEKGPVFTNVLLVDEINRATPKTQSSLLEVMQEHQVTSGGERFPLPEPFFVMATQNPLEMEGTYPLPEAQLDRFLFKLHVPFPGAEELVEISRRTTGADEPEIQAVLGGDDILEYQRLLTLVPIAEPVSRYAAALVMATHPDVGTPLEGVQRFVSYGASPRGMQALVRAARVRCVLDGRTAVSIEDVREVAKPSLRHRVLLNFEGEAESVNVDQLLDDVIGAVPTPAQEAA